MRVFWTTAAVLALGAGAAAADCKAELAELMAAGPKDGSMAPMAEGATPQTGGAEQGAEAPAEGVAKDGSMAPLGTDPGVATSSQDAQAQQAGGATAAEQAAGEAGSAEGGREAALAKAEAALAAGDEAGCTAAVEEAKSM